MIECALTLLIISVIVFGDKSDKKLHNEASKLPRFTKRQAKSYYKSFDYWNKRKI